MTCNAYQHTKYSYNYVTIGYINNYITYDIHFSCTIFTLYIYMCVCVCVCMMMILSLLALK